MTLIKWDPFNELSSLQNEINKVFSENWGSYPVATKQKPTIWSPLVEVGETTEEFKVKVDLPGVKKEDVDLSFSNGTLIIKGERKDETEEKDANFFKKELFYGSFKRQLSLPEDIDLENISASYDHGVLNIKLPKSNLSKERKISIE